MNEMIGRFKEELARNGTDYREVEPPLSGRAHIRFIGRFRGKEVIWDAVIMNLAHYHREQGGASTMQPGANFRLLQFIEVGAANNAVRGLRVGLNVPRIDEATLRKTIIMIRNYRRLHPGRHEFEPAWKPA